MLAPSSSAAAHQAAAPIAPAAAIPATPHPLYRRRRLPLDAPAAAGVGPPPVLLASDRTTTPRLLLLLLLLLPPPLLHATRRSTAGDARRTPSSMCGLGVVCVVGMELGLRVEWELIDAVLREGAAEVSN